MSDILNFNVSDEIFKDAFKNNPFYVQINGEVNLCVAKCGQDIEACNEIEFSTMTNYGKILILNPKIDSKSTKCNIKLAFDTSNDNADSNGGASYNFEKAFITVPALHKIGSTEMPLCDLETFLLFSSIQKNGSKIYVCLCVLSNGTDSVAADDWKLLNFKLMNELFKKQINNKDKPLEKINIVPDIHGTNEINGSPNPIDLSNFLPILGFRNFYDYTHPKNSHVNFRIFQTPLAVSNAVLTILRNKLTPGTIMTNFKKAINDVINPTEGLFFYFNEDLTNKYKKLKKNEKMTNLNENKESNEKNEENEKTKKESMENLGDEIIIDQVEHEKNIEFQKINENDKIEDDNSADFDEKKAEKFDATSNSIIPDNISLIYSIILISSYILISWLLYSIVKFILQGTFSFINNNNNSNSDFFANENHGEEFNKLLLPRLRYLSLWMLQIIFSLIVIFLMISQITKITNFDYDKARWAIYFFLFLICIIGFGSMYFILKYLYLGLKLQNNDDFAKHEIHFFNNLMIKIFKNPLNFFRFIMGYEIIDSNITAKTTDSSKSSVVKDFLKPLMHGGANTPVFVPGPDLSIINQSNSSKNKDSIFSDLSNNNFHGFLSDIFIGNKIKNGMSLKLMGILSFFFIGIFILGAAGLSFLNNNNINDCTLSFFLSLNTTSFCFIPFGVSLIFIFARLIQETYWDYISYVFRFVIITTWILSIFIPVLQCYNSGKNAGALAGLIITLLVVIAIIYFIFRGVVKGNLSLGSYKKGNDKPIDLDDIKQVQNLLAAKLVSIEDIKTKIIIFEDYLSNPGYENDQEATYELFKLKEELNKDIIMKNELEQQIKIITGKTLSSLGISPEHFKTHENVEKLQKYSNMEEKIKQIPNMTKQIENLTSHKTQLSSEKEQLEKAHSDKSLNILKLKNELNREKDYSQLLLSSKGSSSSSSNPEIDKLTSNILKLSNRLNKEMNYSKLLETSKGSSINKAKEKELLDQVSDLSSQVLKLQDLLSNSTDKSKLLSGESVKKIEDLTSYIFKLQEKLEKQHNNFKLSSRNGKRNNKLLELSQNILKLEEQLLNAQDLLRISSNSKSKKEEEIIKLQKNLNRTTKELAIKESEIDSSEIIKLREELESTKDLLQSANNSKNKELLKTRINELEAELESTKDLSSNILKLKEELNKTKDELAMKQSEIDSKIDPSEIIKLREELESTKDLLQSANNSKNKELLKTRINELEAELESTKDLSSNILKLKEELESTKDLLQSARNNGSKNLLSKRILELEDELQEKENLIQQYNSALLSIPPNLSTNLMKEQNQKEKYKNLFEMSESDESSSEEESSDEDDDPNHSKLKLKLYDEINELLELLKLYNSNAGADPEYELKLLEKINEKQDLLKRIPPTELEKLIEFYEDKIKSLQKQVKVTKTIGEMQALQSYIQALQQACKIVQASAGVKTSQQQLNELEALQSKLEAIGK